MEVQQITQLVFATGTNRCYQGQRPTKCHRVRSPMPAAEAYLKGRPAVFRGNERIRKADGCDVLLE
jgi:hypothetical protein